MKKEQKLRIKKIIQRFEMGYTFTLYGSVDLAKHQKESDFMELIEIVKNTID